MTRENEPFAEAGMLIRKQVEQVFEAFINPERTINFWFTESTGRLDKNDEVQWTWEMYDHTLSVFVKSIVPNERIVVEWGNYGETTLVEWTFTPLDESRTFVKIVNSGFEGTSEEVLTQVRDSTEGFTLVLLG